MSGCFLCSCHVTLGIDCTPERYGGGLEVESPLHALEEPLDDTVAFLRSEPAERGFEDSGLPLCRRGPSARLKYSNTPPSQSNQSLRDEEAMHRSPQTTEKLLLGNLGLRALCNHLSCRLSGCSRLPAAKAAGQPQQRECLDRVSALTCCFPSKMALYARTDTEPWRWKRTTVRDHQGRSHAAWPCRPCLCNTGKWQHFHSRPRASA